MNKKTIIGGVATAVAVVIAIAIVVSRSGRNDNNEIKAYTDGNIMVVRDGLVEGDAVDSDDELDIITDDGVIFNAEELPLTDSNSDASDQPTDNGARKDNQSDQQVGANSQNGSGMETESVSTTTNNVTTSGTGQQASTENSNSDGTQSQTVSDRGMQQETIIEDKNTEATDTPVDAYDASEGRSFETERIPVN